MIALLRDDLATPAALALLWETLRDDEITASEQLGVLTAGEQVLGLMLLTPPEAMAQIETKNLPKDVQLLILKRDQARAAKEFALSDELRTHIENSGYRVDDAPEGTMVTPTK
jgi:cysteinyl-tRNA synthetase